MHQVKIHEDDEVIIPCEMLLTWAETSFHVIKKDFENPLNGNCILLDSCRTTSIFGKHGKHLLMNFHKAEEAVKIKCNGGIREASTITNFVSF